MDLRIALTGLTAILAFLFFLAVLDQWRTRRHSFQLAWALGMLWFSIGAGCEAAGAIWGWSEPLYKTWYVTGAVATAAWLGLGTAFLLGKTRFGYAFAFSLFLAGLFTFLTQQRQQYPDAGSAPVAPKQRATKPHPSAVQRARSRPSAAGAPGSRHGSAGSSCASPSASSAPASAGWRCSESPPG